MAAKTCSHHTINRAPSTRVLKLCITGREVGADRFPTPNALDTFREICQMAAEMAFGENAVAYTDGENYFLIRVPSDDGTAKLMCSDITRVEGDIYELWVDSCLNNSYEAQVAARWGYAKMLHDIMSEMTVENERAVAHIDEHMTIQQLFLASTAAEVIAIASARNDRYCIMDASVDDYWSLYQAICQAQTDAPIAYVSTLGECAGIVKLNELQNPYSRPVDFCDPEGIGIADFASMPISNHSLGFMDDDVAAGLILADFFACYIEDESLPERKAPVIVRMNTDTLIEDGFGCRRLELQEGSDERVMSFLASEKEEFLA